MQQKSLNKTAKHSYRPSTRIVSGINDFATICPELAKEWHPVKNGDLKPNSVSKSSKQKVWWLGKCHHEWQARIGNRVYGHTGCPCCSNRQVMVNVNDLMTKYPQIAEQWHPTKNGDLKPTDVTWGSNKKVWWRCKHGHEWMAQVNTRTSQGCGCPRCNIRTHTSFPEQAVFYYVKQYFPDAINNDRDAIGMELDVYVPSLKLAIEYDGQAWHNTKNKQKSDEAKNELCAEFGIQLIRICEPDVHISDNCIVLQRTHAHSIESLDIVIKQLLERLCIMNANIDVSRDTPAILSQYQNHNRENSLLIKNPKLASEWHSTKNGDLTPDMITEFSNRKIWWRCEYGHEWQEKPLNRSNGRNCPYCSNHRVLFGFNDLATKYPDIITEWHPTKNGELKPTHILYGSNKIVWWKCSKCGHEWKARVACRTRRKSGCKICGRMRTAKAKCKKVLCVESNQTFESISDAAKFYNLPGHSDISACCKNKQKTAYGYHWQYVT